jgi:hypothetical protein
VKKYLLPIGAGVVVFGVVTAFAASLAVSSSSLGAGNATVAACQSDAAVTYTTTAANVHEAVVTFSGGTAGDCDGMAAQVTLTGSGVVLPKSRNATVGSDIATIDFTADSVPAHDVTGVSVTITG